MDFRQILLLQNLLHSVDFMILLGDKNNDWADGVIYWEPPQLIDNHVVQPDPLHKTEFGIRGDILRPKSRGFIKLRYNWN